MIKNKEIGLFLVLICIGLSIFISCKKQIIKSSTEDDVFGHINSFAKTDEFLKLRNNFDIELSNLDPKNSSGGKISKNQEENDFLIIPVKKNNTLVGQIWLYLPKSDDAQYVSLYEDLQKYSANGGVSTVYFSNGAHFMGLEFSRLREGNGMSYRISDVVRKDIGSYSMKSIHHSTNSEKIKARSLFASMDLDSIDIDTFRVVGIDTNIIYPAVMESLAACAVRVYNTAKKACESDAYCDTICDFVPRCHATMLAGAVGACIGRN